MRERSLHLHTCQRRGESSREKHSIVNRASSYGYIGMKLISRETTKPFPHSPPPEKVPPLILRPTPPSISCPGLDCLRAQARPHSYARSLLSARWQRWGQSLRRVQWPRPVVLGDPSDGLWSVRLFRGSPIGFGCSIISVQVMARLLILLAKGRHSRSFPFSNRTYTHFQENS